MKALAGRPIPSQMMASGIQAMGGMGRTASKMGVTMMSTGLYQPINSPSGTPINTAEPNPVRARIRLAFVCANRVPPSGLA